MNIYAYFRVDCIVSNEVDFLSLLRNYNYEVIAERLIVEEVKVEISLKYRDAFWNLINYVMEKNDLLFIKGIDSLGSNFNEIFFSVNLIFNKGIRLICYDFCEDELRDKLKETFINSLKLFSDFESNIKKSKGKIAVNKNNRVGRPEILTQKQKEEVLLMFKNGDSVYSIAKKYSVARTVIQRIISR
ncbi:recombinase family protein [Acinetobacter sp. 1125_18A]|uniref:recombinase family protein n=1 Tax=Acinetobacter sp. 1125_18A TaxID=2605959 RepID=UPI004059A3E0